MIKSKNKVPEVKDVTQADIVELSMRVAAGHMLQANVETMMVEFPNCTIKVSIEKR